MLIETLDKLTAGKLIRTIVFDDGQSNCRQGLKVDFMDGNELADAWVCWDETGIWLNSNPDLTNNEGYLGRRGTTDPLSTIKEVLFV